MSLSADSKKYLKYGVLGLIAIGGAVFVYVKLQGGQAEASADASANAQAQAQAEADENQEAELATLGSSGASLSSVSGGTEIPVESFSDELDTLLGAAGLSTGNGTAPVSTSSTAPQTTGTPVANPAVPVTSTNGVSVTPDHTVTAILSPVTFRSTPIASEVTT